MSVTADERVSDRSGGVSWLWRRQLDSYPDTGPRVMYRYHGARHDHAVLSCTSAARCPR